jgi:tetratricopeptide (TPR) repeat protein
MTESQSEPSNSLRYRAFISYSHKDKAIATWLHATLERYRLPNKLVGNITSVGAVPKRLSPIFRDQDELPASGNLGTELQNALANSLFLIVICSPASARSKWVNEEIRQFKMLHGSDKVLALVVDGEPNPKIEAVEHECFAPALKCVVAPNGELTDKLCEPIAADLRKKADGKRLATLKLISGLTALRLDDLVQREAARRMRTLVRISAASFLAAVFAVGLAVYANDRRLDANIQRAVAEQEAANARAVSDFLVNSFASASSIQANPNDITARSILDRGAQRISTELQGQPLVQSRLSTTIALAFNNLGLFDEAIEVVDSVAALSGVELSSAIQIKADALYRKGDLDTAMEVTKYAQSLLEREFSTKYTHDSSKRRSDIARIQALIYHQQGQYDEGIKAYGVALRELERMPKPSKEAIASVLQSRAFILSDIGDMETANSDLNRAKILALESVGSKDILVGQISLAQAQVNFLSWNLEPALEQINFAISNMQRILKRDNPTLADALSMKGQILQAMGHLDEADSVLTEAVNIYTKAYSGRHYLSGIAEIYLALIAGDRQQLADSLAHFEEARLHYDASYGEIHANHGDLLVNRATVLASVGEMVRAIQDCDEGMGILQDTLGVQAAFTQQLQAVCDNINNQYSPLNMIFN